MMALSRKLRRSRLVRCVSVAAFLAVVPLAGVANAQTSMVVMPTDPRVAANLANDLAQCQLAASGQKTNGVPGISEPLPAGMIAPACTPSGGPGMPTTPTTGMSAAGPAKTTATCAAAMGPLTKQQLSAVNDYEIALAKAQTNHTTFAMTPDIAALIGCE